MSGSFSKFILKNGVDSSSSSLIMAPKPKAGNN
jgi:hypothetical protein